MIDFGLLPCPLCGGEAEVARLTQAPDELSAVIKCTDCGLTLEWETEIKVGISRSGKRTRQKVGLDPIEAWNRRATCDDCVHVEYADTVAKLPNCHSCGVFDCEHRPNPGETIRINCPLWRAMDTCHD